MEMIKGDILDAKEDYILHQVNCVSTAAKGLAASIFTRFPECNIYTLRSRGVPGTITITNRIIHLHGQYYPGRPWAGKDSREK